MTDLELSVLIAINIPVFIIGMFLFVFGFDKIRVSPLLIGILLVLLVVVMSGWFFYHHGTTHAACNHWPTTLDEGVLYEKVFSEVSSEFYEDTNGKTWSFYYVWLKWNNEERTCLYHLRKDPPKRFVYKDGEFAKVE